MDSPTNSDAETVLVIAAVVLLIAGFLANLYSYGPWGFGTGMFILGLVLFIMALIFHTS